MFLEKAVIEPNSETPIPVLFNPSEFSLSKRNQIGEISGPGLGSPTLQYLSGNSRTLSMDLFFDTFESRSDARDHTDRVFGLLDIRKETHVPPLCTFRWGRFAFRGVVESIEGRFTMFLPDGTPVRATLSISFMEAADLQLASRKTPLESVDRRKSRVVRRGDTLNTIAAAEYGDPGQWRSIARANGIRDPLALQPGTRLTLPALP